MISPAIEKMIQEKAGDFIIPAVKIANVQADNPLMHAFLILTKVKYAKIPVLDKESHIVGLLSLSMITDTMLETDDVCVDCLNDHTVAEVMQTEFDTIKTDETLEKELHLLVDDAFLPVVDQQNVFVGLLTRREIMKSFNYVAHTIDDQYTITENHVDPIHVVGQK